MNDKGMMNRLSLVELERSAPAKRRIKAVAEFDLRRLNLDKQANRANMANKTGKLSKPSPTTKCR